MLWKQIIRYLITHIHVHILPILKISRLVLLFACTVFQDTQLITTATATLKWRVVQAPFPQCILIWFDLFTSSTEYFHVEVRLRSLQFKNEKSNAKTSTNRPYSSLNAGDRFQPKPPLEFHNFLRSHTSHTIHVIVYLISCNLLNSYTR